MSERRVLANRGRPGGGRPDGRDPSAGMAVRIDHPTEDSDGGHSFNDAL